MAMDLVTARNLVRSVDHWHHAFEIYPGVTTPGSYDPSMLWEKLEIDDRCRDRTVLDIGASDGYFTARIDQLGGLVTAVDFRQKDQHGFGIMEQVREKEFPYLHSNLYDIDPETTGPFDIVLCLGVLYHLPDMMRALRKLRMLCRDTLLLETHSDNEFCPGTPAARYFKADSLHGDLTNFWSPNAACVLDMLYDAAFDVVRHETWGDRLFVEARPSHEPNRAYKMHVAYGRL